MKKVFVHAYLAGNLGDDLMVRILCDRYPKTVFWIVAERSYHQRFSDIANCKVFSPDDKEVIRYEKKRKHLDQSHTFIEHLIKKADAVVHIGGSVFVQHSDDWSEFYNYDAFLLKNAKKLYVAGANFGPYTNSKYLEDYKGLFKDYKGICFRDRYSKTLFEGYSNVSYAPDLVFNLKRPEFFIHERRALISVINIIDKADQFDIQNLEEKYLSFHVRMVRECIRKGLQVRLVSFCPPLGDGILMQKIMDLLSEEEKMHVVCTAYLNDNLQGIVDEFEKAEIVIGTRFHSIILGLLFECKVLPIVYDQKTSHFLDDIGCDFRLELKDLENQKITELIDRADCMKPYDIEGLVRDAEKQFVFLDRILR